VPWENVFGYMEKANKFFPRTGFLPQLRRAVHGGIGSRRLDLPDLTDPGELIYHVMRAATAG
jgi:hypothetical protein